MSAFERIFTPENMQFMVKGAGYSLLVAICALAGGSVLGLLAAMARMGKNKIARAIANVYVEVIRGTPMMLQILLLYLGGPVITRTLFHYVFTPNPILVGTIAIAINSGAYSTELFRSAIQSVDKGQWEAAKTIGLTHKQTLREIILPQAFKRILPPYINEFIVLIKDSSLLSDIYNLEEGEEELNASYLEEGDLGKLKTIFWAFNIVDFTPFLDTNVTLPDGSSAKMVGTWFNHHLSLPTGEELDAGVIGMRSWWDVPLASIASLSASAPRSRGRVLRVERFLSSLSL